MAERCSATSKQSGVRCGQWAVAGTTVCRYHGGLAPQVQAAARRRVIEADARHVLAGMDVTPVVDPVEELLKLAGEALAYKDLLAEKAGQIRDWESFDNLGRSELRAVVGAFESAINSCAKILTDIARLDLSSRRVAVAEAQAAALLGVIETVLAGLDLDPGLVMRGRQIAAERLAELGAGHE